MICLIYSIKLTLSILLPISIFTMFVLVAYVSNSSYQASNLEKD